MYLTVFMVLPYLFKYAGIHRFNIITLLLRKWHNIMKSWVTETRDLCSISRTDINCVTTIILG